MGDVELYFPIAGANYHSRRWRLLLRL